MIDKEKNIGFFDKKSLWLDKHKPGKAKHALTGATYKLKDIGPFEVDFSGAPLYTKTVAFCTLILAYIVIWFWYGWVFTGVADLELLAKMTIGAFIGGLIVVIVLMSMAIDYHKGSFTNYKRILELRVRGLDRSPLKRVELKVRNHIELYNPVVGGYWRALEEYKEELKEAEEFIPIDLEDEEMPYAILEGKRFHSIRDMQKIMEMSMGKGEAIQTKDEIKTVLDLKKTFVDLAEKIRLPFVVTLCDCDSKGGRVYPLFISEHSLFGGSSGLGSFVEFREHTLQQRTWAGIMSKDNVRAGVGEGIELGMYKFYELVPDEFALAGKKEETLKFAPVIFVTASDAQAEKMMEDFRYNSTRKGTVQQDLIDASVIYDSSVADGLFESLKLVVARLKRKEKSEDELRADMAWESKETICRGLEKVLATERAGKGGIFRNINLFSKQSIKYLFYIVGIISIVFFALYLLQYYGGVNVGWLFGDMPGNETIVEDPWGNIIKPLWEMFK